MNKKSFFKRCIAAVLSVAFIIGVIPANAIYISSNTVVEAPLELSDLVQAPTVTAYESDLEFDTPARQTAAPEEEEVELLSDQTARSVELVTLSGTVTDENGNGLSDVSVMIFDFELGEVLAYVSTTSSGTWSFSEAQSGLSYRVSYYHPDYAFDIKYESITADIGGTELSSVTGFKRTVFEGITTDASAFTYTVQDTYYATITMAALV